MVTFLGATGFLVLSELFPLPIRGPTGSPTGVGEPALLTGAEHLSAMQWNRLWAGFDQRNDPTTEIRLDGYARHRRTTCATSPLTQPAVAQVSACRSAVPAGWTGTLLNESMIADRSRDVAALEGRPRS